MRVTLRGQGGGPFWVWCLMLETWARYRFEMGPGGSSVSEGRFGVKAITDSPGFFLFLPLDTNHGRSNFSVWASVSKEHDLDPALRDSSERNHDGPFIPKGNSVPSLRLWGGWFGHGCMDVTEAQNSFPPGILLCGCAPENGFLWVSVESTVSLPVCHTDKPLVVPW